MIACTTNPVSSRLKARSIRAVVLGVAAALGACSSPNSDARDLRPLAALSAPSGADEAQAQMHGQLPADYTPSLAFDLLSMVLEASAQDVERIGARPTILSRQMAIPVTAMFNAWAAYDARAVGTPECHVARRPEAERLGANARVAAAYATFRAALDQFPYQRAYVIGEFRRLGFDPSFDGVDPASPAGLGNLVAKELLEARHHDGANQLGDEAGSDGTPYSDYTMYRPVNTPDHVIDPDRWQPIPFDDGHGGQVVVDFLTPQWYRVRPFGLESSAQFRPGPPPLVGSEQLRQEVDECIRFNAQLDPQQKALVEFMRDGPRSTGQSGHWLRFAQDVSARDHNDFERDVQMYFAVANAAFDAFIASWDAKRYYDSSRPWTLVRHYYSGERLLGWGGPGKGSIELDGSQWHPYSPSTFITPPFPGYTSGHSTVSAACAEMLRLFTGSDTFDVVEARHAGAITENGASCEEMQRVEGVLPPLPLGQELTCDVRLPLATFTQTAELAGLSRVLGGYHIQADNVAGLELGRAVARHLFTKVRAHIDGSLAR
ncbi:MAG: vanadium-dependent haloperoxidase [Planctomycetota bacterium]